MRYLTPSCTPYGHNLHQIEKDDKSDRAEDSILATTLCFLPRDLLYLSGVFEVKEAERLVYVGYLSQDNGSSKACAGRSLAAYAGPL